MCSRHSLYLMMAFIVSFTTVVGCSQNTEPKLPESGSIQEFLDENPDYKEASDLEPDTEEDEFDAAGAGE